ncbi:MAG: hypothetical protein ACOC3I_00370 [Verrucomicrobiota bacterium]
MHDPQAVFHFKVLVKDRRFEARLKEAAKLLFRRDHEVTLGRFLDLLDRFLEGRKKTLVRGVWLARSKS